MVIYLDIKRFENSWLQRWEFLPEQPVFCYKINIVIKLTIVNKKGLNT